MKQSSLAAAGLSGLQLATAVAYGDGESLRDPGYGELVADPNGIMDLPRGFKYKVISTHGQMMDDGIRLPDKPDGMATFAGPAGETILLRNHEVNIDTPTADHENILKIPKEKIYDYGKGETPGAGGVSTLVYDTKKQEVIRQFMSLAGTDRNCAGGPTPWGTWITCEESVTKPASLKRKGGMAHYEQAHGYAFEVPATVEASIADPIPLKEMGRFRREAIAVDPRTGMVYQTEDEHEGLLTRFIPNVKEQLAEGGTVQALAVKGQDGLDTRNWKSQSVQVGDKLALEWMDIPGDTDEDGGLRFYARKRGAAIFARGEGIWYGDDGYIYFACTNGGKKQLGQIWRIKPAADGGELELFVEPNDSALVVNADNLTFAPFGDLIVCEDRKGDVIRLVGVTPAGKIYTFANNRKNTELCGAVFSPDGTTMFVNLQHIGMTVAITGPWDAKVAG
jgi:secreted PhoX family phosphatase